MLWVIMAEEHTEKVDGIMGFRSLRGTTQVGRGTVVW